MRRWGWSHGLKLSWLRPASAPEVGSSCASGSTLPAVGHVLDLEAGERMTTTQAHHCYVAFSGGADSTALALLCPEATPIFADTGWEFPELYQHIERFERQTGREVERVKREGESLPEYIRSHHYMPGHASRFCTRLFKIEPIEAFLRAELPAELLIGLRADEPLREGNLSQVEGLTIRYPLREQGLSRSDILATCIKHDLLPVYPAYMARGGCTGCFYKRKSEVLAMVEFVPEVIEELDALERDVQDEREYAALMFPNAGQTIAALKSQGRLFSSAELYRDAADTSDIGAECGLFCHR